MTGPTQPPDLDVSKLQPALARLLRPLVRLFIRQGITFPAIADLLRELYVNVAEYDFGLAGKSQTDSRVSLLTGIHRKEVRRLRGSGAPVSTTPVTLSRTSRILACWLAASSFTDEQGHPLPLPRVAPAGEPSFDTLVEMVTKDVRPRAVLDDWLDRGVVAIDERDRVRLLDTAFVPRGGDPQQMHYFGRNLHDHIAAAVANIEGRSPRFLERAVHYDGLSEAAARQLEHTSRQLALESLQTANRAAHTLCDSDGGGSWRWNFGVYVFAEPTGQQIEPPAAHPAEVQEG
ncbi:DUF6502 family protein [Lichenifustis flavocetrariae]|uniref:DUF6502 family protein n=1 Tax=Lichenifustis flavocetrariae TaxID=2949735 RepID=A0AA41Z3D6_9HYPH|nr:DUF6502 family protein [Lichenifustis flavocetrariae]MCW6508547.1 DUF6502 family protein [Lichenifustis flavocetrariae]